MAEVFLSVDADEDGEQFFRKALDTAPTDTARLSHALVLAQLLLLKKKHGAYAVLATGTIAPLLFRAQQAARQKPETTNSPQALLDLAVVYAGGVVLLPLAAPEFLAGLPDEPLRALLPRWRTLGADAQDDWSRLEADLGLHATCQRLGLEKERLEVAKRLEKEWSVDQNRLLGGGAPELVEQLRKGNPFLPH
jgi:hypothetical protein